MNCSVIRHFIFRSLDKGDDETHSIPLEHLGHMEFRQSISVVVHKLHSAGGQIPHSNQIRYDSWFQRDGVFQDFINHTIRRITDNHIDLGLVFKKVSAHCDFGKVLVLSRVGVVVGTLSEKWVIPLIAFFGEFHDYIKMFFDKGRWSVKHIFRGVSLFNGMTDGRGHWR